MSKSEVGSAFPLMMTAVACCDMAGGQVAYAVMSAVKLCMHVCTDRAIIAALAFSKLMV